MFAKQYDIANWPLMQEQMAEVRLHPHHKAWGIFVEQDSVWQPMPAPRFSRTDAKIQRPPATIGQHTKEVLIELGFHVDEISARLESGAIA